MAGLLRSKEPQERQVGQLLTRLEYENLHTALNLALDAQVSILNPYKALSFYLDTTQDQQRGLELGQMVLARLEHYAAEVLAGKVGAEFVGVIDGIANRQLLLKQHAAAEKSCQKALKLIDDLKASGNELQGKMKASVYHQLGYVAQEQRQWPQAEAYYQQALAIDIEFNDRYSQASTYHQLGRVAEGLEQWQQAREYFLKDLEISSEFHDEHGMGITLRSLARLWQASGDATLPAAVAAVLGITPQAAKELLNYKD